MTPEQRADALLDGIHSINLKVVYSIIPHGQWLRYVTADGFLPLFHEAIAKAIREAVEAEREACAALCEAARGQGVLPAGGALDCAAAIRARKGD